MNNELLYLISLTQVNHIGSVHAKALISIYGNAENIFKAPRHHLEKIEGIGTIRANSIKSYNDFDLCEKEIAFLEKNRITPLSMKDADYPQRLLNCYDNPVLLYFKGNTDLNERRTVSIVGTRNNSEYGRSICEEFIEHLKEEDVLIVSGLAFGIDTITHKTAVKHDISTVGVLAHGLDRIYPHQNRNLAKHMLDKGGLLTEFISGSDPDRENFPKRNRIVAGLADAVIVIESGKKGGSIITAEIANGYNRDVFAFPGRITDAKSEGCNSLIRNNKAVLLTDAEHFLGMMNWKAVSKPAVRQRELFISLTPDEQIIVNILKQQSSIHIDELYLKSKLSASTAASALLMLEMNNVIISLPGKIYQLNN
jgi:DNA processing protein